MEDDPTTPPDPRRLAQTRIRYEAEHRTGLLELEDLGLEELPEALFELTHLRELRLKAVQPSDARQRASLPRVRLDMKRDRLAALTSLEVLVVQNSDLTSLAPLRCLANLHTLDCSDTRVDDLMPL